MLGLALLVIYVVIYGDGRPPDAPSDTEPEPKRRSALASTGASTLREVDAARQAHAVAKHAADTAALFTLIASLLAVHVRRTPGRTDEEICEEVADSIEERIGPKSARWVRVEYLRHLRKSGRDPSEWEVYAAERMRRLLDVFTVIAATDRMDLIERVLGELARGRSSGAIFRDMEAGKLR